MENLVEINKSMSVLIVEDDEMSGRLLLSILTQGGIKAQLCREGQSALEFLSGPQVLNIDLILTDIMMPVMGGIEFIMELRRRGKEIPFIIVSSLKDPQTREKARELGAYGFINKPFKSSDVLARVNQYFLEHSSYADRLITG